MYRSEEDYLKQIYELSIEQGRQQIKTSELSEHMGFSDQSVNEKVKKLADIQKEMDFKYLISVDGGVNQETLGNVLDAGTDIVVSGSSFFRGNLEWK